MNTPSGLTDVKDGHSLEEGDAALVGGQRLFQVIFLIIKVVLKSNTKAKQWKPKEKNVQKYILFKTTNLDTEFLNIILVNW